MPIVEAARLEAAAAPGQTLANAIVRTLVGTRRALRFRDVGELTLKGIPAPLATVEVIDEDVVDSPRPPRPVSAAPAKTRRPMARVAAASRWSPVLVLAGSSRRARDRTSPKPSRRQRHLTGITAPTGTARYERTPVPRRGA